MDAHVAVPPLLDPARSVPDRAAGPGRAGRDPAGTRSSTTSARSTGRPGSSKSIECLHAGATRYCEDLLRSYGTAILDVPIDLAAVLDLVTMVATGAIRSPAATSALVVDDDFCGLPRRVIMANGSRLG